MSNDSSGSGYVEAGQEYQRDSNYITDRITSDGSGGWPVEAGR
ncbi:MAG: gto2, partial [Modestobacter sp.]|nr:gto2 [Modestobacter sp.]